MDARQPVSLLGGLVQVSFQPVCKVVELQKLMPLLIQLWEHGILAFNDFDLHEWEAALLDFCALRSEDLALRRQASMLSSHPDTVARSNQLHSQGKGESDGGV